MKLPGQNKVLTAIVGSYPKPDYVYPDSGRDLLDSFGVGLELQRQKLGNDAYKSIMLGVLDVGEEAVESVESLVARGREALRHVPKDQLILAPDCGMIELSRESARQKLKNARLAAQELNRD